MRRLCLLIFDFRRFFNEPISSICIPAYRPSARNKLPPRGFAIRCGDQSIVANCHIVREERPIVKSVCERAPGALGNAKVSRTQPKSEGPKAETRRKSEPRNPNQSLFAPDTSSPDKPYFGFRVSGYLRPSVFDLRISRKQVSPSLPTAALHSRASRGSPCPWSRLRHHG